MQNAFNMKNDSTKGSTNAIIDRVIVIHFGVVFFCMILRHKIDFTDKFSYNKNIWT